ncbi:hypothetical protein [Sphingobium sp. EM0848]|uniref:hypothetical protein n=1 Tax=Sphingobium sp. EM0848 TaxID=2743473 RepID=UPI00159C7BE0|nr:hypothetical protein [Sphingobium sp. EM0848]
MAISLLPLPKGNASLEFAPADLANVREAISALFGPVLSDVQPTYARLTFGGETFLFEQEWDEPCLIAQNEAGTLMLEQLLEHLQSRHP